MLAQLAPTTADDTLNLPDTTFLDRLYQLGAAEYFDVVAAAAYGFDQPPSANPAPDRLNFRRPKLLRQATERHGDGDAPIWITAWAGHRRRGSGYYERGKRFALGRHRPQPVSHLPG